MKETTFSPSALKDSSILVSNLWTILSNSTRLFCNFSCLTLALSAWILIFNAFLVFTVFVYMVKGPLR